MSDQHGAPRTVLLIVHTGREEATETAQRVQKVLGDNGILLRVLSAEAVDRGSLHVGPDDVRAMGVEIEVVDAEPDAAEGCELVLVLGGDGTFLRAAELARNADIPVLGINLGRIGFLAEAEAEALDSVLEHVVARSYRVEERLTLDILVRQGGSVIDQGWALNEASLEKGPRLGVLGVVVEIEGRRIDRLRILGRRPGAVAGLGSDPGGAQQRSRALRPANGHQSRRHHRHRDRGQRQ
jgi:NAD+ kinase